MSLPVLLPQQFLREGGTLEQLTQRYHINVKRGVEHPNLVLLKYNQISALMSEPLVQQCRGLILDESDNWKVVSRPFDKFFNLGEPGAADIDWKTAVVLEKLDGSLMQMYWYKDEWRVGTSGTPDASGDINGVATTFKDLFWRTFDAQGLRPALEQSAMRSMREFTFLWELTGPLNRIVVKHSAPKLTLLGLRDSEGREFHATAKPDWPGVKPFDFRDAEEVTNSFRGINPLEQEGYVVVDVNFRRVKVKHPGYVELHQLRDGFGPKRVLDVVRRGETAEVLTHFPEWVPAFERVREVYEALAVELEGVYEAHKEIPVQKDFAEVAKKTRHSAALFLVRSKKQPSIRAALADMNLRALMDLLGVRDMEF